MGELLKNKRLFTIVTALDNGYVLSLRHTIEVFAFRAVLRQKDFHLMEWDNLHCIYGLSVLDFCILKYKSHTTSGSCGIYIWDWQPFYYSASLIIIIFSSSHNIAYVIPKGLGRDVPN